MDDKTPKTLTRPDSHLHQLSGCFFSRPPEINPRERLDRIKASVQKLLRQPNIVLRANDTQSSISIVEKQGTIITYGISYNDKNDSKKYSFTEKYRLKSGGTYNEDNANGYSILDKKLYVLGPNHFGQLGLGHESNVSKSVEVLGLSSGVQNIYAFRQSAFLQLEDGIYGCGINNSGQLGLERNKDFSSYSTFTRVEGISGKIEQCAMGDYHSLILTKDGLYGAGSNRQDQLGMENEPEICGRFTKITHLPGKVLQITAGRNHTFVLTSEGLYACGRNEYGQLGLGDNDNRKTFVNVPFASETILQIQATFNTSFIITTQGLYSCGDNEYGQLGLGDLKSCNIFTKVENIVGEIQQISTSGMHTMLLTSCGLYTCGNNFRFVLGPSETLDQNDKQHYIKIFTQINNIPAELTERLDLYHEFEVLEKQAESQNPIAKKEEDKSLPSAKPSK